MNRLISTADLLTNAQARLLKDGKKMDVSSFGLNLKQQAELLKLTFASEKSLDNKRIEDWFDQGFFETYFWLLWTTMFAFQKWSSLAEMRRYMKRFIHLVEGLPRLGGVLRTRYNQYHWSWFLSNDIWKRKECSFKEEKKSSMLILTSQRIRRRPQSSHLKDNSEIVLGDHDYVFITNGSITESTDNGIRDRPARLKGLEDSGSWQLWKRIAAKDPSFGRPGPFCDNIDLQKWFSFTATLKDSTFHDYMENFSGNIDGTGGLVTMTTPTG